MCLENTHPTPFNLNIQGWEPECTVALRTTDHKEAAVAGPEGVAEGGQTRLGDVHR